MKAPGNADDGKEVFTVLSSQDGKRTPVFCVLVKRTYTIRANQPAVQAEQPCPLVQVDEYYDDGDPQTSTVKFESDLAPYKLATDVVLIGKAHAPGGKPAPQMDVSLEIGDRKKEIRVLGDRRCIYRANRPPSFTDPIPFQEMEIRYERAYGGKDLKSDPAIPFYYPRNFMGTGIAVKNLGAVVDGLPLPNLEDPNDPLTPERVVLGELERWNQLPLPQGFGWFQKTWYPRCSFVGAVPGFVDPDEVMREETLGLVPRGQIALARRFKLPSFDTRFNNGASAGLAVPYLAGGEPVKLVNLTPSGLMQFTLPRETPRIVLDIGLGENELQTVLHTVCMRLDEMQVDLVWRGAHEYPGIDWLPELKRMDVKVL